MSNKSMSTVVQHDNDNANANNDAGSNAFAVYCDKLLSDAVQTNKKLRSENLHLETTRTLLERFQLFHGTTLMYDGNLHEGSLEQAQQHVISGEEIEIERPYADYGAEDEEEDTGDVTYLFFEMDEPMEIPIRKSYLLHDEISGIHIADSPFKKTPELKLMKQESDDGTIAIKIAMEYFVSDYVSVIGTVQNQVGTLEEVCEMIRCNQHAIYFSNLGYSLANADGPHSRVRHGGNTFEGGLFTFQTIKMDKKIAGSILTVKKGSSIAHMHDEELQELELAAKVMPSRIDLSSAFGERKDLLCQGASLKLSRQFLKTFCAYHPDEASSSGYKRLPFDLEKGVRSETTNPINGDTFPTWCLTVPEAEAESIPIACIANMHLRLSGLPWSNPCGPLQVSIPRLTRDFDLVLQYSHSVSATFSLDDSLSSSELASIPGGVFRYIHCAMVSSLPGRTTNYAGPEFPNLTMRLIGFEIRLNAVENRLDALGIDY